MANFVRSLGSVAEKFKSTSNPPSPRSSSPDPSSPTTSTTHVTNSSSRKSGSTDEHVDLVHRHSSVTRRVNSPGGEKQHRLSAAGHELVSKLQHLGHHHEHKVELPKNREGNELSKNQARKREQKIEKHERREAHDRAEEELQKKRDEEEKRAAEEDSPEMRARYGALPINYYAGEWKHKSYLNLTELTADHVGKEVCFRCRLHNIRKMSAKLVFFVLRQQITTIQGVLQRSDTVSDHLMHWAEHLPIESIVLVRGTVQTPKAKEGEVIGALIHDKEIMIQEMKLVSKLTEHLPFSVMEAETTEAEADAEDSKRVHIGMKTRLAGRVLDLRTTTSHSIFRVQAGVCNLFRSYLDSQGFIEIHTPKLQGGATESGASVFKLDYFGRPGFLAQSPQLAKQMSIAADFPKVYEIGAVFRAENSNTHRHLTEYTGLDLEMAIVEHYHEVRNTIDSVLKAIFKGVYERYKKEIALIKTQFPHEDLVWLEETPVLKFRDAIQMLNETGWLGEDGKPLPLNEDLGTRDEIQLGKVIKEKYKTDYYIIDKFPASARPFYTMPDPEDPTYTNSFDIFVRGQEIVSGGQRVHDANMLAKQMEAVKVDPKVLYEYMQGFEWGAPPHGGAGVGLERLLMLMLQLTDIRNASMYPRDPKSLPQKAQETKLRHPEASTLEPPWTDKDRVSAHKELQPLEKLIANYGDASNTSWLEPKFVIWREQDTGAAVAYCPHMGYAITVGNPLCAKSQYKMIIGGYLEYIKKETSLKPLWLLCGSDVEDVLAMRFDWRTFTCASEQRLDLTRPLRAVHDNDIQRKIRHATKEGVKIHEFELGAHPPKDFRDKIDKRVDDWLKARKNHQHVHLTDVHPWQDMDHRQYHYAVDKNGTIAVLVIMAQLAPEYGWQVKFSLDFPDAPSGAVEATITHALVACKNSGAVSVTFGGGASNNFQPGHNLKGAKVKMLSKAYHTVATELKLTQKSEFREKLGAEEDPIYVCYPPKGLGPKGVHAILTFFED